MKLRQIKKIKFWSLRPDYSTGAYRELDEEVTRLCRCVRAEYGLKWQVVKKPNIWINEPYGYFYDTDQECLDNLAMENLFK